MMGPTFSIIVPCYNLAPWIRACLDSVLAQSYADWECIVVDDESKDESGKILDEYAARDVRIRVIHQANKGEGGSRNTGIAAASGEWILFLDGDDVIAPASLEKLKCLIDANPQERLIRFGYEVFEDGDSWTPKRQEPRCVRKDISGEIPMCDFYTFVWQHIYRREIIAGIAFKRYIRGCDRVFIDDVLLNRVDSLVETNEIFYGYRKRMGSAMNSVPSRQVLCDEMDHRLDIIEMIDASGKDVDYKGNLWLEGYLTCGFYHLSNSRRRDRRQVVADWRKRLCRLRSAKKITAWSKFAAWTSPIIHVRLWDEIVFHVIPALTEGRSVMAYLKRKIRKYGK